MLCNINNSKVMFLSGKGKVLLEHKHAINHIAGGTDGENQNKWKYEASWIRRN